MRTIVFIDKQNAYMGARECFFGQDDHYTKGQFSPAHLGRVLAKRIGKDRELVQVRVYAGLPSGSRDPKGFAAARRQYAAWGKQGVEVLTRALRYPPRCSKQRPVEKGVDVQLAIDFVALAHDDVYDTGVVFSSDTDLIPALEFVLARYPDKEVCVGAWAGRKRLVARAGSRSAFCHFLDAKDYRHVSDDRDYTR